MPAISILTPVWNSLPYLKETVESVLAQGFTDWELILADDGSTDGSRDYLATLDDPRIRVIINERNLGIFGNLNLLFREAQAPLVYILCADDYFLPGGLARTMELWAEAPPAVAYLRFNWGENAKRKCSLSQYAFRHIRGVIPPERSDLLFYLLGNVPGNLSNVSVRTERVREAGYFREDLPYAGDFEMWARMGRRWPFVISDLEATFVRRHPGVASIHLNRKGELVAQQRSIVDDLYARLKGRYPEWLLKLHGTANYDTLQRDAAIKALLSTGKGTYLSKVNESARASESVFSGGLCWVIYGLLAGGRWGRDRIAARLLAAPASR